MTTDYSKYFKAADAAASVAGTAEVAGKGKPFWTPPTGGAKWKVSRVRILPPPIAKEDDKFYTWAPTHNLPGVPYPVLCPSKHGDQYCPACEMAQRLQAAGDKDGARDWWPSWRAICNVVIMSQDGKKFLDKDNNPVAEPIPYLWGLSKRVNEDLQGKIELLGEIDGTEAMEITDVAHGRDVFVRRQGSSVKDTRYEVELAHAPSAMPPAMFPALATMHALGIEDIYEPVTGAQMQALLSAPQKGPAVDPLADDGDFIDAPFKELTAGAPEEEELPFADDDEDGSPFEDDDTPEPAVAAAPAAARLSEARAKLLAKVGK